MANGKTDRSGHYEQFGENDHFIPAKLPPIPTLQLDSELLDLYGKAMQSLGRFAEAQKRIPGRRQFLDVYIAKEAVLSSQIENINTTLTQVLEYKSSEKYESKDVQEVLNYIEALHYTLDLMKKKNLPISSRIIRECHKQLLSGVRGENKMPGNFRKVPVFVGKLIPPPAHYIEDLIANLEKFINEDNSILPLIKTGLVHVQFETIHPFLDGNGRVGRLLIVIMLLESGLISDPVLYPSFYFMKYRGEYYSRLDDVRLKGDYEGWIKYYLRAIQSCSDDIVARAWAIDDLLKECSLKVDNKSPGIRKNANKLLDQLCITPVLSINDTAELISSTYVTAKKLVDTFVELGILRVINENRRNKSYIFHHYLEILEKEFVG